MRREGKLKPQGSPPLSLSLELSDHSAEAHHPLKRGRDQLDSLSPQATRTSSPSKTEHPSKQFQLERGQSRRSNLEHLLI